MKTLNILGSEGTYLNIKGICEKSTANFILNGEKQSFPSKIKNRMRMSTLHSSLQHYTGRPSQGNQTRKRNKRYPN